MKLTPITAALAATSPVADSAFLRTLCAANLAMYPAGGGQAPWQAYLAEESGRFVGACAFKGPPDAQGVEIAYFTFAENEGQGVATRMAEALLAIAARHGVATVRAASLPANAASIRVLERLGFRRTGSLQHPDDGELWSWQRPSAVTAAANRIRIRPASPGEAPGLWAVFQSSVRELASADYTPAQIEAWAPAVYPGTDWEARIARNAPFVAELEGRLAGFADLQDDGYIDQFFVARFAAHRGIGSALMQAIEQRAAALGLNRLHAAVSLTAQPFFRRHGFIVETEQQVAVRGEHLRNARMQRLREIR